MRPPQHLAALLAAGLIPLTYASPNCALRGPAYPKPTDLSSHLLIIEAAQQLTAGFDDLAANDTNLIATNNSWSLEAWSIHENAEPTALLWSHYHAATNLDAVNSTGTREVDGSTVYRLGSVTKIFTVLTWLAEAGDEHWFVPITNFVPELRDIQERSRGEGDAIRYTDWDAVTVGALASQMSGIPRDYSLLGELTQDYGPDLVYVGFPPPEKLPETPECGIFVLCNRTQFFEGLEDLMPVFAPEAAPAYSNVAYVLLAYALEEITGKDWLTLLTGNILEPLALERTFFNTPNDTTLGVIPGNASQVGWYNQLGDGGPSGSMYASSADLTRLNKAILSSELLPPAMTRRWLRPVTFTSDPMAALGTPWGIRRINMGHPYLWTYGYQKAGRIGDYSALIIMLPDYGVGFTLLTAGNMPGNMNFDFADVIGATLLPAIHNVSRAQAQENFAGNYEFGNVTALNSSMVITVDDDPGLKVERWISNGTDMATVAILLQLSTRGPVNPRIRLYPTSLETVKEDGDVKKRIAFKATFEDADSPARENRLFSTDCATWLSASSNLWAARTLDEIVFEVGEDGRAVAVDPVALRAVLDRVDELTPPPPPPAEEEPPADEGSEEKPGEDGTGDDTGEGSGIGDGAGVPDEGEDPKPEKPVDESPPVEEPPADGEEGPETPNAEAILGKGMQTRKSHSME